MFTRNINLCDWQNLLNSRNVRIVVDGDYRPDWMTTYPFAETIGGLAKLSDIPLPRLLP